MSLRVPILVIFLSMAIDVPAIASPSAYFVDSIAGNDGSSGLGPENAWQTLSRLNSAVLLPGDRVFLRRGRIWRETLVLEESGTMDQPIVISAYGDGKPPTISGAEIVSGWVKVTGSVYRSPMDHMPSQVFEGNARLRRNLNSPSTIEEGEWSWEPSWLYVNIGFGPSSSIIEATRGDGTAEYGIMVDGITDTTIDDIQIERFRYNIFVTGSPTSSTNRLVIQNCLISEAFFDGIMGWDDVFANRNIEIRKNRISSNGGSGINWKKHANGAKIAENIISNNGQISYDETQRQEHRFRAGIYLWGGGIGVKNIVIENNAIFGTSLTTSSPNDDGNGVWIDMTQEGNVVRYNRIFHNANNGIVVEAANFSGQVYYNLVFENGYHVVGDGGFGLVVMRSSYGWTFSNNTIVGNRKGIGMGDWVGDGVPNNNTFLNNIVGLSEDRELQIVHGAQSLNNIFRRNCVIEKSDMAVIIWGQGVLIDTVDDWESVASPKVTNNTGEYPMFTRPDFRNFRLDGSSPLINDGLNVDSERDIIGHAVSQPPTIGCYEKPGCDEEDCPSLIFLDEFEFGTILNWTTN